MINHKQLNLCPEPGKRPGCTYMMIIDDKWKAGLDVPDDGPECPDLAWCWVKLSEVVDLVSHWLGISQMFSWISGEQSKVFGFILS